MPEISLFYGIRVTALQCIMQTIIRRTFTLNMPGKRLWWIS